MYSPIGSRINHAYWLGLFNELRHLSAEIFDVVKSIHRVHAKGEATKKQRAVLAPGRC
jgi:hypothetical protein